MNLNNVFLNKKKTEYKAFHSLKRLQDFNTKTLQIHIYLVFIICFFMYLIKLLICVILFLIE